MENCLGIERSSRFRLVVWGMNPAGDCRRAGALRGDGGKAPLTADLSSRAAHHAVMLAVSAAASWKTRIGIGGQHRRNQHPTE